MDPERQPDYREALVDRRTRLEIAAPGGGSAEIRRLLGEVDAALARLDAGTFGRCDECGDAIEPERLRVDPLVRLCIDHLTDAQQRALERDLEMAARVQAALLPRRGIALPPWEVGFRWRPAGVVGGDYLDVVPLGADGFLFVLADVSGKGVAASLLTAHLHALFRSLAAGRMPVEEVLERANRQFCESTLDSHYATLLCGVAGPDGTMRVASAGHPPPLRASEAGVETIDLTGVPLGLFCDVNYDAVPLVFEPGESLTVVSDGVLDSRDAEGAEYGRERLAGVVAGLASRSAEEICDGCEADLARFTGARASADDRTILVLRRGRTSDGPA